MVRDRGFGFILPEGAAIEGQDLFFHRNDVRGMVPYEQLQIGQAVKYDLKRDERRGTPKAANVQSVA